ncbi:MAG: enoyl-CoA hydratase/isomerase family protein [Planctomycetes bacterium]|nr:enoyl-CoA hydratase/isomerase family protein [Planctomycetota bacterium]
MKPGLKVGDVGRLEWTVDPSMIILLGGDPRAAVFSTPNMILLMERAAREAIRPFLEPGEESVGVDVQIQHVGGAGLGASVRGEARVLTIDGRKIQFEVEAFVEDLPSTGPRRIGHGLHTRALVSVERLIENLSKQSGSGERAMNLKSNTGPLPNFRTLLVEIDKSICTVTLNRPRVLNAVNAEMTSELEQVIAWLFGHPEEVRVVLLRGAGDAFCAGDDVKELPGFSPEYARELSYRQAELYLAFERLPQPVIALVHGDAFGGGCVAAYSADMRIARHDARFAMPEIKLGWPPGYGIAQLTALVGKSRALEMCLMGQPIAATRALEWGLISEIVPGASLMKRGMQIAESMLAMPAEALRATKRLVHLDEGSHAKVAYRADTDAYIRCLQMEDAREGIQAFIDKRAPRFRGK